MTTQQTPVTADDPFRKPTSTTRGTQQSERVEMAGASVGTLTRTSVFHKGLMVSADPPPSVTFPRRRPAILAGDHAVARVAVSEVSCVQQASWR
jgi:hypothetical protein